MKNEKELSLYDMHKLKFNFSQYDMDLMWNDIFKLVKDDSLIEDLATIKKYYELKYCKKL